MKDHGARRPSFDSRKTACKSAICVSTNNDWAMLLALRSLPARTVARQPGKSLPPQTSLQTVTAPRRRCLAVRNMASATEALNKDTSESKWKEILTADEYYILRQKGTEAPGTGVYNKHKEEGVYNCAGCGADLYKSETKFDSGCGWPAFYAEVPGAVDRHEDRSFGTVRVEITCKNCGGHLGHVFSGEGFPTPTDQRHCVNSKSIKFKQ